MIAPVWVNEAVVITIHRRQLAEHGGSDGIRDRGLLESALYRPCPRQFLQVGEPAQRTVSQNQYAYGNPNIFDLAAAYGYGIAKNHPFVDGNKRTAYVVTRTVLKLNGYDLQASTLEKYQVWMQLAGSQIDEVDLAKWLESKSVEVK